MTAQIIARQVRPYTGFYSNSPVRARVVSRTPYILGWEMRTRWYVELEVRFVSWGPMRHDNPAAHMATGPFETEAEAIQQANRILDRIETPPPNVTYVDRVQEIAQQLTPPQPELPTPEWGDVVRSPAGPGFDAQSTYAMYDPDDEPHGMGTAFVAILFCGPVVPRLLILTGIELRLATQEELDDLRVASQEYLRLRNDDAYIARRILVDGVGRPENLRTLPEHIRVWDTERVQTRRMSDDNVERIVRMGEQIQEIRETPTHRPDGLRQIDIEGRP